ncbi:MAG: Arm DNA-binding domain-containing protein [Clostridiales bacterium]|nr:Arm DNA-binding domain-containing protein [Clostridiales bacterium]
MGSIVKEDNGIWTVYYDRPAGGRRNQTKKHGFTREREAKDFLRGVEKAVKDRTYVARSQILFVDYIMDVYMADIDRKGITPAYAGKTIFALGDSAYDSVCFTLHI